METKFKSNYQHHPRTQTDISVISKTKQQFKDECDVNNILKKFMKTGVWPYETSAPPAYGDFTNIPDYQESLHYVIKAQDHFAGLSARVRERFMNDTGRFLEFMANNDNYDEALKLGLVLRKEVKKEAKTESSASVNPEVLAKKGQKPGDPL